MTKIIFIFQFSILLMILFNIRFGSNGSLDNERLKNIILHQKIVNEQLLHRNNNILNKVNLIKQNEEIMVAKARQELGLVKRDEILITYAH